MMRRLTSACIVLAAACGHDSNEPGGMVQLEAAQAVTTRIGASGGQLRTTDSHGRTYVLDIPPMALRDSVDITLTPVASYEMPSGATLLAAAQFAPEGLRLAVPGRLAIVAPGGAPGAAGFGYSGQGDSLHLDLLGRHGDTLFLPVRHFSGAGVATTTDISLLTPSLPSGAAVQAYIDLETLTQQGRSTGVYDVAALAHVLSSWAAAVVIPALNAASSEQTLLDAVARYDDWEDLLNCGADVCNGIPLHLWPEAVRLDIAGLLLQSHSDAQFALAHALKAGIDRLMAQCATAHDLQAAANALYWEGLALANGVQSLVPGLQPESFYDAFCVRLVFESVALPDPLVTNAPGQLQVRAGLSYGGGAVDHADPIHITVSVSNAAPATLEGSTANGTFTTTLVPTGTSPIFLGIHAALTTHALDQLAFVVHDTTYERAYGNVAITPTAALLDPGAQAQFTATVTGLGSSAVTWSATGGTLSGTSGTATTYTAGSTAGTFAVTATSVADPTQRASARVDILSGVTVVVSPASVSLAPGGVQQFTATVTGTADHSVSWSALGGTSVVAGNTLSYTAGNTPGVYAVSATSIAEPSAGGAAQVSIGFQPGDIYAGTLTYQAWPFPVPAGQEAGVTAPFAFILSAAQNTWVTCNASGQTITAYSTYCALAGSPFSATTPAAFLNVSLDGIGRLGTTPTGSCYYSGQLQNVTVSGGGVHGTGATGVLYCPANGNYQVYFTFTTVRR